MTQRTLNFDDRVRVHDEKEIHISYAKDREHRSKQPKFYTEIECRNELGEMLFTEHNETLLSGGVFLLQKIANVESPINIKTINTDMNLLATEADPGFKGLRREHAIFGFMIGLGGCTDVFDTVKDVKYKERIVNSSIPFRMNPTIDDLSPSERSKYFLRVEEEGFYKYFAKKFEVEPKIHVVYDEPGFPQVPPDVDLSPDDKTINSYIQFNLKITKDDVRDYFKQLGGGINKARINSIGLVYGYPDNSLGYDEYKGVRVFSKLNFNNEPLDNETKELNIIYKIYI